MPETTRTPATALDRFLNGIERATFLQALGLPGQVTTGIGTLASMMLPYSMAFLMAWTLYLLAYWGLGIPLGLQSAYTHP